MKKVEKRNDRFTERQTTKIWQEIPHPDNPYIATEHYCHGYKLTDLMKKRSFVDVFFLLFNAKLPTEPQAELLEQLMIAMINPGPRHPATRAGMNAAVGKTDTIHILPISLAVIGGTHLGAFEVEKSMRFIKKHARKQPAEVANKLLADSTAPTEGDWHPAPGFGNRFSGIDEFPFKIAEQLLSLKGAGKNLSWGHEFAKQLTQHQIGWVMTGVAAAALLDAGFSAKCGAGVFQLLCAPGMLAHGLELANKPITAMPFIKDEDYFIEEPNKPKS